MEHGKHKSKSWERLVKKRMMNEVMHNEPSTVARADVSAARKQKMRIAIGLAKARKAGVHIPKARRT